MGPQEHLATEPNMAIDDGIGREDTQVIDLGIVSHGSVGVQYDVLSQASPRADEREGGQHTADADLSGIGHIRGG